jgi:ATPase subunit of ABC transporter with duplicated ATPase domains
MNETTITDDQNQTARVETKTKRGRKNASTVVRYFQTSVWNPIDKKCENYRLPFREGDDEKVIRDKVIKWREDRKEKYKMQKARMVLQDMEKMESKFKLVPFKFDINFKTGRVVGFIGSSGSGKTTLMKKIYKEYFDDEDFITVLYAANINAPIYKSFGRKVMSTDQFDDRIPKIMKTIQKSTKNKYRFLNILDDQVDDKTKNNPTLRKMITSYRNSQIYTFIALQDKTLLSSINRGNLHKVFFMKLNSDEAIERIIRTYLSTFLGGKAVKMPEKIRKYRELTCDYKFIMLDNITEKITVHEPE